MITFAWVANFFSVEINYRHLDSMLELELAKLKQMRLPLPILQQIFRGPFVKKDMAGIAQGHYALRA